jgi:hypothetical protein
MTPISQFVLNSTTTRPSIFVQKKREEISEEREKKIRACFMKNNLFVTSKNEFANPPIYKFKVLQNVFKVKKPGLKCFLSNK